MTPFLLWLLATIDSAFIGYREAAGRNALIEKRAYYRRALMRGALYGQVAVLIVGLITAAVLAASSDPRALFSEMELVGSRMLTVYIPYAVVILITFCVRALPSVDIRSITSVLIFGPFTFIRPFVVLVGALWGVMAAPHAIMVVMVSLLVVLMLGMGRLLGRR
jgi:hypothetical protein